MAACLSFEPPGARVGQVWQRLACGTFRLMLLPNHLGPDVENLRCLPQDLPGDQWLGHGASPPRADVPDVVHQRPGLPVRRLSVLHHQDSESRAKTPQELLGFPVALQSRKSDVYCEITQCLRCSVVSLEACTAGNLEPFLQNQGLSLVL